MVLSSCHLSILSYRLRGKDARISILVRPSWVKFREVSTLARLANAVSGAGLPFTLYFSHVRLAPGAYLTHQAGTGETYDVRGITGVHLDDELIAWVDGAFTRMALLLYSCNYHSRHNFDSWTHSLILMAKEGVCIFPRVCETGYPVFTFLANEQAE